MQVTQKYKFELAISLLADSAECSLVPRLHIGTVVLGSLVPRPCAFVACSTGSDERAGPGNEARYWVHVNLDEAMTSCVSAT